jgi:hypothetical protein
MVFRYFTGFFGNFCDYVIFRNFPPGVCIVITYIDKIIMESCLFHKQLWRLHKMFMSAYRILGLESRERRNTISR